MERNSVTEQRTGINNKVSRSDIFIKQMATFMGQSAPAKVYCKKHQEKVLEIQPLYTLSNLLPRISDADLENPTSSPSISAQEVIDIPLWMAVMLDNNPDIVIS